MHHDGRHAERRETKRVELPAARSILAVCAHPDDESFGLGALLGSFRAQGTTIGVLCFTQGEASTLHQAQTFPPAAGSLRALRSAELAAASEVLGIGRVELRDHADGGLDRVPLDVLADDVADVAAGPPPADLLLVFDQGGITGHPDHCRATEAARQAGTRLGIPVLAWAIPARVADELNAEFGAGFVGRPDHELPVRVSVDRDLQLAAIACHASQATDNPVLRRRLALLGSVEAARWLPGAPPPDPAAEAWSGR